MNFASELPQLYQLFLRSDRSHPDNYFSFVYSDQFSLLADSSYLKLDRRLAKLDPKALENILTRSAPLVAKRDRNKGRDWTQLFNELNEAKGYEYLLSMGYSNIHFVPRSGSNKTPDLMAEGSDQKALLEVKSINRSDIDIESVGYVQYATNNLPEGFKQKVRDCYKEAQEQCMAIDRGKSCRWFCYFCLDLDGVVAVNRENQTTLDAFIKGLEEPACVIAYQSGVWN